MSSNDWTVTTLPASLIVDPSTTIVFASSRSVLKNCNIRPSWFTSGTPTSTIRDLIAILRQFSGTGVECTDDGCSIQNVAVYGFDVGIRADESQRFYMNNVVVDSNVGVWWHAMAGASKNMNLLVDPVITQGNPNTEEDWSVTSVSADTNGECKLTLSSSPDDLRTDADTGTGGSDTIWVYGIGGTFAIDTTGDLHSNMTIDGINPTDLIDVIPGTNVTGSGIPALTTVTGVSREDGKVTINNNASTTANGVALHFFRTNTGPTGCDGRWLLRSKTTTPSYTVTLKGSSYLGPSTNATWHNGSRVMTVSSLANIAPGQSIQSGSGIPTSTTVVNVLPATGTNAFQVIMSNNATADELAPTSRSFSNAVPLAGDAGQLILSAAPRVWTGNDKASGPNVFVTSGMTNTMNGMVTGLSDTTRIQPGMSVTGVGLQNDTIVNSVDSASQITLSQTPSSGGPGTVLTFTGCGYPGLVTGTKQPWLGNCVATAYLMGGPAPGPTGDEDQGLGVVQAVSKSWQVGFHLFNALDTRCTGCQANGAAQLHDKSEIGIWYDAASDETLWAGGGVHAYGTALLHAPTAQTNCDIYSGNDLETAVHDGFDFVHIEGCVQIVGSHTHNAADAYISAGADNTVLQGNYLPNGELYYENSSVAANTAAVGNTFKNGIIDQTTLAALGIGSVPAQPLTIGSAASGSGMCLYNTADQTTNYERGCLRWTSNAAVLTTEKGGTGTARDLTLNGASGKINLQSNGATKFTVGVTINGSASGVQIASTNSGPTQATFVPNRAAPSSTGIGADAAGDVSLIVGANEDVRFDASHHTTFKGTAPTVSSGSVVGSDVVGRISLTSSVTSVMLTFAQSWTNPPICLAQDETTGTANPIYASTVSTSAVTFTSGAGTGSTDKVSYRCVGYR